MKKGWHREPARHSLAARGVKSKRNRKAGSKTATGSGMSQFERLQGTYSFLKRWLDGVESGQFNSNDSYSIGMAIIQRCRWIEMEAEKSRTQEVVTMARKFKSLRKRAIRFMEDTFEEDLTRYLGDFKVVDRNSLDPKFWDDKSAT